MAKILSMEVELNDGGKVRVVTKPSTEVEGADCDHCFFGDESPCCTDLEVTCGQFLWVLDVI